MKRANPTRIAAFKTKKYRTPEAAAPKTGTRRTNPAPAPRA